MRFARTITAPLLSASVHPVKKHRVKLGLAALAVIFTAAAHGSSEAADPQQGEALVRQWCDTCHLADNKSASDVGPPFGQIANDPSYTDARLRAWLHEPHPPMPKFEIDRRRIDNIIAYIRTLKK